MTATNNYLTLLHEAIDGMRAPNRFEVGERCWVYFNIQDGFQLIEVEVVGISGGLAESSGFIYRCRIPGAGFVNRELVVLQYDLLKYDVDVEAI